MRYHNINLTNPWWVQNADEVSQYSLFYILLPRLSLDLSWFEDKKTQNDEPKMKFSNKIITHKKHNVYAAYI